MQQFLRIFYKATLVLALCGFTFCAQAAVYAPGTKLSVKVPSGNVEGTLLLTNDAGDFVKEVITKEGIVLFRLPFTQQAGGWAFSWLNKANELVGQKHIDIAQDQSVAQIKLEREGDEFTLQVLDKSKQPLAYKTGQASIKCVRPIFPKWKAYSFGIDPSTECQNRAKILFVTTEDGKAVFEESQSALWDKAITVQIENNARNVKYNLPVNDTFPHIGVHVHSGLKENSSAFFDVVVTGDLKPKKLGYAFYEAGRKFKWASKAGRWTHKYHSQNKRVASGTLTLKRDVPQKLSLPVKTGRYVFDILSADGTILAQKKIEVGGFVKEATQKQANKAVQTLTLQPVIKEGQQRSSYSVDPIAWHSKIDTVQAGARYKIKGNRAFVSPLALPPVWNALNALLYVMPQQTAELAHWLRTIELWYPVLRAMGLVSDQDWMYRKDYALSTLLMRQQADGGFAAYSHESEIASTREALHALYLFNKGQFDFEEKRAQQWLMTKLRETTYHPAEREERALAFHMLAQFDKADPAALDYFEKKTSGAVASLADKKHSWKKRKSFSLYDLEAIALAAQQGGTWKLKHNDKEQKYFGVTSLASSFVNLTDKPLYVVTLSKKAQKQRTALPIERELYHLDGDPVQEDEGLLREKPYVMQVSGQVSSPMDVVLPVVDGVTYQTVAYQRPSLLQETFPWLAKNIATPLEVIETKTGLGFNVPQGIAWQAIVLVTPTETGSLSVPDMAVWSDGTAHVVQQEPMKFEVR